MKTSFLAGYIAAGLVTAQGTTVSLRNQTASISSVWDNQTHASNAIDGLSDDCSWRRTAHANSEMPGWWKTTLPDLEIRQILIYNRNDQWVNEAVCEGCNGHVPPQECERLSSAEVYMVSGASEILCATLPDKYSRVYTVNISESCKNAYKTNRYLKIVQRHVEQLTICEVKVVLAEKIEPPCDTLSAKDQSPMGRDELRGPIVSLRSETASMSADEYGEQFGAGNAIDGDSENCHLWQTAYTGSGTGGWWKTTLPDLDIRQVLIYNRNDDKVNEVNCKGYKIQANTPFRDSTWHACNRLNQAKVYMEDIAGDETLCAILPDSYSRVYTVNLDQRCVHILPGTTRSTLFRFLKIRQYSRVPRDTRYRSTEEKLSICEVKVVLADHVEPSTLLDVRLVDGYRPMDPRPHLGRVEVKIDGGWGTVCADEINYTDHSANVICRSFGYTTGTHYRPKQGQGSIALDNVNCSGDEKTIFECPANKAYEHDCHHGDDYGVQCRTEWRCAPTPKNGYYLTYLTPEGDIVCYGENSICSYFGDNKAACEEKIQENEGHISSITYKSPEFKGIWCGDYHFKTSRYTGYGKTTAQGKAHWCEETRKFHEAFIGSITVLKSVALYGGDLKFVEAASQRECHAACVISDQCGGWTYLAKKSGCYLKRIYGWTKHSYDGATSHVLNNPFGKLISSRLNL